MRRDLVSCRAPCPWWSLVKLWVAPGYTGTLGEWESPQLGHWQHPGLLSRCQMNHILTRHLSFTMARAHCSASPQGPGCSWPPPIFISYQNLQAAGFNFHYGRAERGGQTWLSKPLLKEEWSQGGQTVWNRYLAGCQVKLGNTPQDYTEKYVQLWMWPASSCIIMFFCFVLFFPCSLRFDVHSNIFLMSIDYL